ncbi:hypothetical protein ACFZBM_33365 [Streptomyces lavendulae]|uniref:Uncharacterized protein n=1 Tax=Streptomyces lavendulae subsp. lavendulae TaxID=58340 RepID=A0A2K8PBH2_STRLA|nr:hypothetical protein [Streptomyces lavendulae]ATZ23808.1 hypothetical protein SLAV_09695 [Streptomyces lavendulae subsp. lavendulae]QUQ53639.1 hypothetical protein SLLC_07725 [Streptomyces lavendulae subsp. lavendulae]
MSDDGGYRDRVRGGRWAAVAVTLGAVAWIACVAVVVARGWGA